MRGLRSVFLRFIAVFISTLAISQTQPQVAPLPRDPLEPSTGATFVPDTPQQRALVLNLVERARQNSALHIATMPPFTIKVAFSSSGQNRYTGAGDLEETWMSGQMWRWSAHLGDFSISRIGSGGVAYDEKTPVPIPLRIHLLRAAVFWPVVNLSPGALLRIASANWSGLQVMCVLYSRPGNPATATPGRRWEEIEYCMDVHDGLLRLYSEAPGIYVTYDYKDALRFHGRVLPRNITITEGDTTVIAARVESIQDAAGQDSSAFAPTAQMKANGPGPVLMTPGRFPLSVPLTKGPAGTVQPVIVLAEIGADGKVVEAEVLQDTNPALSRQALDVVMKASYPRRDDGAVPQQRQWYINVRFGS